MERVLLLKNLTCANCAAKIEDKIKTMDTVKAASFSIGTQQLRITSSQMDNAVLIKDIQAICDSIEDGVAVEMYERPNKGESHHHHHESSRNDIIAILIGAIVMLIDVLVDGIPSHIELAMLVITYLYLGWHVLWSAIKNIGSGQVFDENFLMSVATLGALIIGEAPEAVGVMLFFRIGEFFEEKATARSRSAIMEAIDMRPEQVRLVNADGNVTLVDPKEVAVGQSMEVLAGERIPLDGTVLEGTTRIDTAPVTGEPVPIQVKPGDEVLSGCINESGRLVMRVDKALKDSMVTRILEAVENAAATKPKLDRFITRFARIYTPIVVAAAVLVAIVPSLITGDWNHWIYTALTFLVISCPCALVLSVPLAFFAGIGKGSRHGILFKGGLSIEAMSHIKAIAMDKTGTLTTGVFAVREVKLADQVKDLEDSLEGADNYVLKMAASLESQSTHPVAVSIVNEASRRGLNFEKAMDLKELSGRGMTGVVAGKSVAVGNRRLMSELGVQGALPEAPSYGSEVLVAIDAEYVGTILISDSLKEDTKTAVTALKNRGLKTVMLTGDGKAGALYMASEAGIDDVRADLLPVDKLAVMQELRTAYGPTMFVGDGINDAPVLAGADVGGAMGSGADAAIEAADVVYMSPSMESVVRSLSIAKSTLSIAWQNVIIALGVKILVMIIGILGYANMWLAVFADTGVSIICILNAIRILYKK
ncbi:heavy metal translocating P-type ATPase [uncultured Veillonella sp.]|uniref:heavy metal translocating P-type ATPase n=1 Tax=uncultured Veillonella sp. TaxID=159268 RepID=UPI0025D366F1|nr:heavy metal translocating P-type ATPase [uncultured Veillonella sp.]MDY3974230.1 heavy metal translocating P-type ATPase [Veillonella caviae]